ncbi:DUF4232 domain-containing protein [Streptomyces sp. NPDC058667]|uniref:DUF4232 domain-containing protein n=1 Tax=Streptomyces sp. NPDC058667 TaxID=3346588 RepID=UPI003655900C
MNTHVRQDRQSPRGWKPYAVGAAVVAALLASTACRPAADDGAGTGGASGAPSTPSATGSATPGGAATTATPGDAPPATTGATPGSPAAPAALAACTVDDLAVSAVKEPAGGKENKHLLLTVQNSGDDTCLLHHYPHVRLGADARTTVPVIKDSDPDPGKPVSLAPGDEAHAALLVRGGARDEYEARSITLTLQGREPGSRAGGPIDVPMPAGPLYADDGQLVTYWTTASGLALDFITSR